MANSTRPDLAAIRARFPTHLGEPEGNVVIQQLVQRVEELERLIDSVAHDVRIVTEHRAARERGGQHVGTGGPLSAANPSTLAYLERLVRNAKGPTNAD